MRRVVLAIAAALVVVGAGACAAMARSSFVNPGVELKDVRVRGIGTLGGSVDVILIVDNPNDYRLDASKVTYHLFVDTTQIAMGEVVKMVTLEPKKKTEVVLPVAFGTREMFGVVAALSKTGSVDYRVVGDVTVATAFGNFTRPYEGKGRFDSMMMRP